MPSIDAIIQTNPGLRQLRLMDALTSGSFDIENHAVALDPIRDDAESYGLESAAIDSDLKAMKARHWVEYFHSLAGINGAIIKQAGVDAAKEYRAYMKNKARRNRACRDAYLHWMYEGEDASHDFRGAHTFHGSPFSEQEIKDAKNWLNDEGFIKGSKTGDNEIYYAQITSKGIRAVESDRSVNDWHAGGITLNDRSIRITDSTNINVAQDSENVTQSNTLTKEQAGKINDVIESYRALSAALALPEQQLLYTETLVGEIEKEVADEDAEPGKIRKGLERLGEIVSEYGAKGVSTALFGVIEQALQNLG